MSPRLTNDELSTVLDRCTTPQIEALTLWNIGLGYKRIALVLYIHPTTAKARVRDGLAKVGLDLEAVREA